MLGITLKQQAKNYATSKGWSEDAANTVAGDAVEICGSNLPIFSETEFRQVMREAMRNDGESAQGIKGDA